MSLDKSSGSGDEHPGQAPEHRPFPGQPEDRPLASRPTGYRSFEEISAERAARTGDKGPGGQGTARDSAGTEKGPSGEGSGTAGTGPRGTSAAPGTREGTGAALGNAPARGEGAGPQFPVSRGQETGRPDALIGPRPDGLSGTDRPRLRPFPGQPESRPLAPRPTGYRSFEEISAERAGNKPAADRGPARPAERTAPGRSAAKDAGSAVKDAPAAKPGTGTAAGREVGPREQGRGSSDQEGQGTGQARENSAPADKANAAQADRRDSGSDRHPDPAAPPGKASPGTPDGHHPPDSGNLSDPGTPPHDTSGILHAHSEFRGHQMDLYTDGTRWVGGDAVRAAQAEAARTRTDGQPEPERHGITDVPQMRDLGRNTVGEKEERSPGDTSDLPPAGEELIEMEDMDAPRAQRFGRKFLHQYDDFVDGAKNETDVISNVLAHPAPAGHAETTSPASTPGYSDVPRHAGPSPSAVVETTLVTGLVLFRTGQAVAHMVNRERRSEDDGH